MIIIYIAYNHNVVCDRLSNIFHCLHLYTAVHFWLDHWNRCKYQVWTELLWVSSVVTNKTARFLDYRLYLHTFRSGSESDCVCVCKGESNLHALLKSAWESKTSTKSPTMWSNADTLYILAECVMTLFFQPTVIQWTCLAEDTVRMETVALLDQVGTHLWSQNIINAFLNWPKHWYCIIPVIDRCYM